VYLSCPRHVQIIALLGFLAGAAVGGRIMAGASAVVQLRAASSVFASEIIFLVRGTLAALGYSVVSSPHFLRLYAIIAFTAIAMGMRNAAVPKLAVPDLTTTLGSITLRHSVFMALAFSVVLSSLCSVALLISTRLPCARNAEKGLEVGCIVTQLGHKPRLADIEVPAALVHFPACLNAGN
jgi:hypothetical protein